MEREAEEAGMSRRERDFADESIEDHQADDLAAEHLGGIDPQRLLGLDDRDSPRDPAP
jgi:hypothetical protein